MLSYNSVANYNIQRNSIILCHQLPTQPLTPNNKASTLPHLVGRDKSLCHLLQRSTVEPLLPTTFGRIASQLPSMNWICSYFGDSSQSTAYNAGILQIYVVQKSARGNGLEKSMRQALDSTIHCTVKSKNSNHLVSIVYLRNIV